MINLILFSISMLYVWFIYYLILTKKNNNYKTYYEPVSVIIPCYNEDKEPLLNCINSIKKAKGKKEIILVNNNSNKEETIEAIKEIKGITILEEKRQGKRFAHEKGLSIAKHDIIVFVDSDTIIEENAILELVKPMKDKEIGGVTGEVVLANKDENWWTKALDSMFWTSNNIFRKATTSLGFMEVMAGALSCYRKEDLKKLTDIYINQTFLGRPCAISDDRFLTMRVQTRLKKKIAYNEKAIAYTVMPNSPIKFLKVIERWKRGMIREVLLLWKEPKKGNWLLFLDAQYNLGMFVIMMITKLFLIYNLIFHFSLINIVFVSLWFLLMNIFWGALLLTKSLSQFKDKMIYSFINEFFLSFTFFQALWNIRKQGKWNTRTITIQ